MFSILKCLLIVFLITVTTLQNNFPKLTGPYLGQKPPDINPVKFPFNFLPEGYKLHSAPAFMPGEKEVYFSAMNFNIQFSEKIFVMKMSYGVGGIQNLLHSLEIFSMVLPQYPETANICSFLQQG